VIDASPSLEAARGVSGKHLLTYLREQGWTAGPSKVDGIMILSKDMPGSDLRAEFVVPVKSGFSDEERRIADALRTIAQMQGCSEAQIAASVQELANLKRSKLLIALTTIQEIFDLYSKIEPKVMGLHVDYYYLSKERANTDRRFEHLH
jgi:hypothetical protein